MEPERKIEIVEREYWTCACPEHRHLSKAAAIGCINRKPNGPLPQWSFTDAQTRAIAIDLVSGKTLKQVMSDHGVSQGQAERAVRKMRWRAYKAGVDIPPGTKPGMISSMREHKEQWISFIRQHAKM